ncbi:MAG: zinc ribbon domain-containing protein [Anaerolineae bacterium]|jgi:hypothetical protein|nr:zinc ribbon domain-containing protein [Anaerolineae bacterium]
MMDINELFSIICFSIPILIFIGIVFVVIVFLIIRGIIRKARRKAGIPKEAGTLIRQQLANFDQYLQNDPRQVRQWESSAQLNEPELDLDDIDLDEPAGDISPQPSANQNTAMPNWSNATMACEACGAPQQPQDRTCPFCGHRH